MASPTEAVLGRFQHHLVSERGVRAVTADAYVSRARRFVAGQVPSSELRLLQANDVTGAVLAEPARVPVAGVQMFVASLGAFLRFCCLEGLTEIDLSGAALSMTSRRRSSLPKAVSSSDADALLSFCDQGTAIGQRDYAVMLLLLRLGLRAGEVAAIRLDDLDWRSGDVVVHGKGGRLDRLPLPADVGEAVAAYLSEGRPRCPRREVFLRAKAPLEGLSSSGISQVVRAACKRAGLGPFGAHRLRHGLACQMVAAGPCPRDRRRAAPQERDLDGQLPTCARRSGHSPLSAHLEKGPAATAHPTSSSSSWRGSEETVDYADNFTPSTLPIRASLKMSA